eukprot:355929-Chlamydomonas_euryale.AAC.4
MWQGYVPEAALTASCPFHCHISAGMAVVRALLLQCCCKTLWPTLDSPCAMPDALAQSPRQLATAAWALAKLGRDPGQRWIAELLDRTRCVMRRA